MFPFDLLESMAYQKNYPDSAGISQPEVERKRIDRMLKLDERFGKAKQDLARSVDPAD